MNYILILREGDIGIIRDYAENFQSRSNEELVDLYNQEVKVGITGVHRQALYLCGLGHVFHKRFGESPINLDENVLSIGDVVRLVDGQLKPGISITCEKEADINQDDDQVGKEPPVIKFVEDRMIRLEFCSLIIRVSSIRKHFSDVDDFFSEHGRFGISNGEILLMKEMNSPPHFLIEYAQNVLSPLGFKEKEDFIFAEEIMYCENEKDSNKPVPHPSCEGISWLTISITPSGNFAWEKKVIHNLTYSEIYAMLLSRDPGFLSGS